MKRYIKTSIISDHQLDLYRVWYTLRTVGKDGKVPTEHQMSDIRDFKELPSMKSAVEYAVKIKMTDKDL